VRGGVARVAFDVVGVLREVGRCFACGGAGGHDGAGEGGADGAGRVGAGCGCCEAPVLLLEGLVFGVGTGAANAFDRHY